MAFNYIAECLKSVILTSALVERRLGGGADAACRVACLEQLQQLEQWGKVEWHHDVQEQEMRSRVSAALLVVYLGAGSKFLTRTDTKSLPSKLNATQQR